MSARERLLEAVGPALAFSQARAAGEDLRAIDFDAARRLWIERLTGESEGGTISLLSATLEEGLAPSIPRIRQWQGALTDVITRLRENPDEFGANLIDYTEL